MHHLFLEMLHLLANLQLLSFYGFLVGGEVAVLIAEELMDLIREELDIFKHVPQVIGVDGDVAGVGVRLAVVEGVR